MNVARDTALSVFKIGQGDLHPVDAVIRIAVVLAANRRILSDPELARRHAWADTPAPVDLLTPVTIASVAATTGLPFETARRRAARLVAAGWFEQSPRGLVVRPEDLQEPGHLRCLETVAQILRGGLGRHAAILALEPDSVQEVLTWREGAIAVRACGLVAAEFFIRVLEESNARTGSLVTCLILSEIIQENIGHLGDVSPAAVQAGTRPHSLDIRKRPASAAKVAAALNLDRETSRRHLKRLQRVGLCERVGDGYIVPRRVLESPTILGAAPAIIAAQRRMYRRLAELGVVASEPQGAARAVVEPQS